MRDPNKASEATAPAPLTQDPALTTPAALAQNPALTARAPSTQDSSDAELKVGDRVQIEAEILAVTGEFLTLNITRPAVSEGVARPTSDGTTMTLSGKQVRKI